jgi:thiol-disulfide isomerase/thioredoxin
LYLCNEGKLVDLEGEETFPMIYHGLLLFRSQLVTIKILIETFLCIFLTVLILFCLSIPIEGDDLFLKTGIQLIKKNDIDFNFCLKDLKGRKAEPKDFKGKVIFLNFWATWCGPCKEEMPSMEALYRQFKEKDFVFLTVSVDYGGIKPVKEFIKKNRYTFPVLLDPKCETLEVLRVKGIPTTIIIDKKGRMIGKAVDPRNWKSSEFTSLLKMLLEEQ